VGREADREEAAVGEEEGARLSVYHFNDWPFAVVTVYADGSGLAVREFQSEAKARAWIEACAADSRDGKHERRLVSLPALLAWVRGNEVPA